ncbi:MAG: hypothetical protein RBS01_01075 [Candidatus Dojkabacteria bacterium]|jgi:hypothetical protein|nr:hypothetical protein [Candidatus Dojkabacteria bacterium]
MDNKYIVMYRVKRYLKIFSFALLFLLIGLLIFEYIRIKPKDVYFTNITSSSVSVSWTTSSPMKGYATVVDVKDVLPISFLTLGKELSYDTRDIKAAELLNVEKTMDNLSESEDSNVTMNEIETEIKVEQIGKYYTHHIEIKNLDPQSEYRIMVGDGLMFTKVADITDNKVVKTTTIAEDIVTPIPIYGSVRDAQGKEGNIQDLPPVSDAIVYFNYTDNVTGRKSNIVSGSINESGNWYLDVSDAFYNGEGVSFVEEYGVAGAANILGEVTINTGTEGIWKKTVNIDESAPVETIVINDPTSSNEEDMTGSVVKISALGSNSEVVKGVNAMEAGCYWISYCGCGSNVTGTWVDCDCDPNVLVSRGCTTQQTAQEAVEDVQKEIAATQTTNEGGVTQTCTSTMTQANLNAMEAGLPCCWSGVLGRVVEVSGVKKCIATNIKTEDIPGTVGADGDIDEVDVYNPVDQQCTSEGCLCQDPDGCRCLYDYENSTAYGGSVIIKQGEVCATTYNETITRNCDSNQVYDAELGCVTRPSNPITPGSECNTNNSSYLNDGTVDEDGKCIQNDYMEKCNLGNVPLAAYNIYGVCEELGACNGGWKLVNTKWKCTSNDNEESVPNPIATAGEICPINPIEECWKKYTSLPLYMIDKEKNIFICLSNTWEETNLETLPSTGNDPRNTLDLSSYYYFNENGDLIHNIQGLGYPAEDSAKEVFAMEITVLSPGELCSAEEDKGCLCKGGYDNNQYIANGERCIDVYSCWISIGEEHSRDGRVCRRDGRVCDGNNCVDSTTVKGVSSQIEISEQAYAQTEGSTNEYILDPQTGMIGGLEEGSYIFEHQGKTYLFSVTSENLNINDGNILIYIDSNANAIYDEGVDTKITDLASKIEITTLQQTYNYSLKQGFNFISVPFLISNNESKTAAGLLTNLNEVYNNSIYSISKYDGKWKVVGQNSKVYDNNDFQLIPGQGYIIKASRDIDISIVGQPVKFESSADNANITLFEGWNLIGMYGTNVKQYTAKSLIQGINASNNPKFTANNVTNWESDVQRYDGFQLDVENGVEIEYGFDFPIKFLQGYFVRVTEGQGNWQPELR